MNDFRSFVEGYTNPKYMVGREISNSDSFDDILGYIKEDFGGVYDITKNDFEKSLNIKSRLQTILLKRENTKLELDSRAEILNYYQRLQSFTEGLNQDYVKDILKQQLGIKSKQVDNLFNEDEVKKKVIYPYTYIYLSIIFFALNSLFFISSIVVFLFWLFDKY